MRLGGLGLTSQARIAAAACVGSWALIWRPMQQLCPQLFAGVELSTAPQQVYQELRRAHAQLSKDHAAISAAWGKWDKLTHDYDKAGESHHAFHPSGLAKTKELLPLARFGADDDFLKNAQRRWSSVSHHTEWRKLQVELQGCSRREAVRFVSVSQPGAGAFLNAVPKHAAFRLPTWALRIAIQRRLGLPLVAAASAAGEGRRSRHGRVFDSMGDCAANDGEAGHGTRHFLILNALYDAFRRVYGGQDGRCVASPPTTASTPTIGPTSRSRALQHLAAVLQRGSARMASQLTTGEEFEDGPAPPAPIRPQRNRSHDG